MLVIRGAYIWGGLTFGILRYLFSKGIVTSLTSPYSWVANSRGRGAFTGLSKYF